MASIAGERFEKKQREKMREPELQNVFFFYTDQNRQTRFYPKKGRNSRPFYHLTKKIQNGQKLPKNGLISPIYFSSEIFTPTCQFYTDISQLWQRTDTLKKIVFYFCCTHFTNFNSIFQFNRQKRANRSNH